MCQTPGLEKISVTKSILRIEKDVSNAILASIID